MYQKRAHFFAHTIETKNTETQHKKMRGLIIANRKTLIFRVKKNTKQKMNNVAKLCSDFVFLPFDVYLRTTKKKAFRQGLFFLEAATKYYYLVMEKEGNWFF